MAQRNYTSGFLSLALLGGIAATLPDCASDRPGAETRSDPTEQQQLADEETSARARALVDELTRDYAGHLPTAAASELAAREHGWRATSFGLALASADTEMGPRPEQPTRVRDRTSGMELRLRLSQGADAAPPVAMVDGLAVYLGAGPSSADLIRRLHPAGIEDFFYFASRPAEETVRYALDVTAVAGLRLVGGGLELLDAGGAPRLRVTPPYLVDATGSVHNAELQIEGCRYDDSSAPPWGRKPTAPGAASCNLAVSWAQVKAHYPVLLDPQWETTQHLVTARKNHTATLLDPDAEASLVLIVGGLGAGNNALQTVELYHPLSRTFALTGPLTFPRAEHTATSLTTVAPSGGRPVLVAGGRSAANTPVNAAAMFEVYDPDSGTFSSGPAGSGRWAHTATLVDNDKVVVLGGKRPSPSKVCEFYQYVDGGADSVTPCADMTTERAYHTASLLPSGAVLLAGGVTIGGVATNGARVFDPANETYLAVQTLGGAGTDMLVSRMRHTAVQVPVSNNGEIAIIFTGGSNADDGSPTQTFRQNSDIYRDVTTPSTKRGFDLQGSPVTMAKPRADHSATTLPGGAVVLAGGRDANGPLADVELATFDELAPSDPIVYTPLPAMANARFAHAALLVNAGLSDPNNFPATTGGQAVLVSAGASAGGAIDAAEVLVWTNGDPCFFDEECLSGICADAPIPGDPNRKVCCNDRCDEECFSCSGALSVAADGVCAPIIDDYALPTKCIDGGTDQTLGEDDVEVHTACNGLGQVKVTGTTVCTPNTCNGSGTACATTCSTDADCSDSGWCDTSGGQGGSGGAGGAGGGGSGVGECAPKQIPGTPCGGGNECQSPGLCVDGVCCNEVCDGQCEACNVEGKLGSCDRIGDDNNPASPVGTRPACEGAGTSCALKCVGGLTCEWPSAAASEPDPAVCACDDQGCAETHVVCDELGSSDTVVNSCDGHLCASATECAAACETDADCTLDYVCDTELLTCRQLTGPDCDGDHTLRIPAADDQDCSPYRCDGSLCLSKCSSVDDCVSPNVCSVDGVCVASIDEPTAASCSCELPGNSSPDGWRWALATLGLALARRLRRPRSAPRHP